MTGRIGRSGARALVVAIALGGLVLGWWWVRFGPDEKNSPLDTVLYFLPMYEPIAAHFRDRVLPLWNPYQLCGIPWIGTLQGGVFYPSRLLYVFLPLHQALAVAGVLHLAIAAVATAVFVRRLGLGEAAACMAAAVFVLRGQMSNAIPSPNSLEAMTWLPVGAIALVDLARGARVRSMALLAMATGLSFLAGYPQPTVYVVYAWGTLFVALLIREWPSVRATATRLTAFGAALALGGLLAAIQLLPAVELMRSGTRASAGLTDQTMFPFSAYLPPAAMIFWRQSIEGAPWAIGIVALALAPAAIFAPGNRVMGIWALALFFVSGSWALGRVLPFFDWFFEWYLKLPAMRLFRNPSRLLVVSDFAIAIAAALGLSAVVGRAPSPGESRMGGWSRAMAVVVMALALAGVMELVRQGWAPLGGQLLSTFAVVMLVGIVALICVPSPWRFAIGATIAMASIVEIASNPSPPYHMPATAQDLAIYGQIAPELRTIAARVGHERVWRALPGIQVEHTLKLSTWYKLRNLTDYEPVNLQRQSDYFMYLRDGSTTARRYPWLFSGDIDTLDAPPGGTPVAARRRLLDVAAVKYVLFGGRTPLFWPTIRNFVAEAGLVARGAGSNLSAFENPHAFPRAFVTYRTRPAPSDPDAVLAAMSDPGFDPLVESFVEGPPPFEAATDAPGRGHPVAFVRDDETEVELEVQLERPGLVVLADSFYPGWQATVDGAPAPIVATNHLFRGVPAPAGTHRVRLVYSPASVWAGGVISVLAAAGLLVMALLPPRRSTAETPVGNEVLERVDRAS